MYIVHQTLKIYLGTRSADTKRISKGLGKTDSIVVIYCVITTCSSVYMEMSLLYIFKHWNYEICDFGMCIWSESHTMHTKFYVLIVLPICTILDDRCLSTDKAFVEVMLCIPHIVMVCVFDAWYLRFVWGVVGLIYTISIPQME